jgi:hypothetical protein
MPGPPSDREALIAALAEAAGAGADDARQPEPEELLDFLAGRLDPEEEARVSRRLVASPDASRALLDLADLEAAGAAAGEGPRELGTVAAWRDFERRLPGAAPRPRRLWTLLPSVAAALLVATLGLSVLRYQGELSRPVANLRSLELFVSRAGTKPSIALKPGAPLRLVIAPLAPRCPVYRADVERLGGGDRWSVEDLRADERGNLSLFLRRVEPGTYSLRLSGCEPQRAAGTYRFQVTDGG